MPKKKRKQNMEGVDQMNGVVADEIETMKRIEKEMKGGTENNPESIYDIIADEIKKLDIPNSKRVMCLSATSTKLTVD